MTSRQIGVQCSVFPSALGWMAIAGKGDELWELTFGHDSPRSAAAAIHNGGDLPSVETDNGWNPRLVKRLQRLAEGEREDFADVPLHTNGESQFELRVIAQCRNISYGRTLTYGELAEISGSPRAARAVGNIMAKNRTPLVVPCHRVVSSQGPKRGGYSAGEGLRTKLRLLEMECS